MFGEKNQPSVKHGGGSIIGWASSDASWPRRFAIIDKNFKSYLCQ